jgi:fumarate reductase flavoprotein subunit
MSKKNELTRRDFLKGAAVVAGGEILIGCAPNIASTLQPTNKAVQTPGVSAGVGKSNFETTPASIPDSQISKTITTEIVVVGAGTSGLVCANAALESGAKVVVITASKGNISRGGSIHAMNSKLIRQQNIPLPDTDKFFRKELATTGGYVDQDKWWKYAKYSEEAINWLMDKMDSAGLKTVLEWVNNDPSDEPTYTPIGSHCITDGKLPVGMGQQLVVDALANSAKAAGADINYKTVAKQLERENNNTGRVTAVIAQGEDGKYIKYVGTKAIVLATGDFSADKDMMAKYCPSALPLIDPTGDQGYDNGAKFGGLYKGDGQKMGLWIGAAWQKTSPNAPMYLGSAGGPAIEPGLAFYGLNVNKYGYRYSNEDVMGAIASSAQMNQPDMDVYSIWGANYAKGMPHWATFGMAFGDPLLDPEKVVEDWEKSVQNGAYVKADTVKDLVGKLKLPSETLNTISQYNGFCKSGVDEDFFKRKELLIPIDTPPFYGCHAPKPSLLTVMGGLRTNINMQVCDANDQPIPGLYNVGTMVGDYFGDIYNFRISGNNLGANCVTFGYLTGKFVAKGS